MPRSKSDRDDKPVDLLKVDVDTTPLAEMEKLVEETIADLRRIRARFLGLASYTEEDRRTSTGKFRSGESAAIGSILDTVDLTPAHFAVLGDDDSGKDPDRFETELLRDRLARRDLLARVVAELDPLYTDLSDTVLNLGELTRVPALAAYEIAKPLAKRNQAIRNKLAAALAFYARFGRRGSKPTGETE